MTIPIVKTAIESDEAGVIDALELAYVADPAIRWVWPDPQKYLSHFPIFARAFGGKAFVCRSAYYVGNYHGAALWLPPNFHPDVEQLIALLKSTGSDDAKKYGPEVFEKMGSYHYLLEQNQVTAATADVCGVLCLSTTANSPATASAFCAIRNDKAAPGR